MQNIRLGLLAILFTLLLVACQEGKQSTEPVQLGEVMVNERLVLNLPTAASVATIHIEHGMESQNIDLEAANFAVVQNETELFLNVARKDHLTYSESAPKTITFTITQSNGIETVYQAERSDAQLVVKAGLTTIVEGISEEVLNGLLANTPFSLRPDSFSLIDSNRAVVLIDIGNQGLRKAETELKNLLTQKLNSASIPTTTLHVSPEFNYGVSMGGIRYTSSACEQTETFLEGIWPSWDKTDWASIQVDNILEHTGISQAHAQGWDGSNVTVVVLDTGIDQFDVFNCAFSEVHDGHGSHIANILKAIVADHAIDSTALGLCNSQGACSNFEIVKRISNIASEHLVLGKKVILNLSFGGGFDPANNDIDSVLYQVLKSYSDTYLEQLLLVAAAGNYGLDERYSDVPHYPAGFSLASQVLLPSGFEALPNVISVGSAGVDKKTGTFKPANFNPQVKTDLIAPGIHLCLADSTGKCAPYHDGLGITGSSYATPIVAGIAALAWQKCPDLSAADLRQTLLNHAPDGTAMVNGSLDFSCGE